MAKPSVYPDFAMDDAVDTVSGQNNVVEPSAGKKSLGWARHEIPPRQHMNWIHRISAEWVRWLEEITDANALRLTDLEDVRVTDLETVVGSATSVATASTLVMRDASGRFRAADPSNTGDVANRGWILARIFESGVRSVFYQAAAPNGWTIVGGVNDRALLAVSSGGGALAGSWSIAGLTVAGTTLTNSHLPTGYYRIINIGGPFPGPVSRDTGSGFNISQGGGQSHTHSISNAGTWRPAHATVLICSRNNPA